MNTQEYLEATFFPLENKVVIEEYSIDFEVLRMQNYGNYYILIGAVNVAIAT